MRQLLIALFAVSMPAAFALADDVPKQLTFARYQKMMDHSPFAVATAVAPPSTASFAKDLFVANAAKSAEGDLVTIGSTSDKNFKKYLTTNTPVDGYSISNVEWSDKVGATKVTIAKDGQFATLTFNQSLLSQPLASAPSGQPQQPAVQGQPQPIVPAPSSPGAPITGTVKPAPIPMLPTPPPRVRGVIPRNPTHGNSPATSSE